MRKCSDDKIVVLVLAAIAIIIGFHAVGESAGLKKQVKLLERIIEQHGIAVQDEEARK